MADRIPVKAIYSGTYGSSDVTSLGELSSGETINGSYITDNSVTLAKMAGGTDGNLITYDASGDPAYVTTGTSGQILTSGGAGVAPTFQTAAGGNAPYFYAKRSGNQALTDAVTTKITFGDEVYDSDGCYDPTTNHRFTPTTAGKYFISSSATFDAGGTDRFHQIYYYIKKNGSTLAVVGADDYDNFLGYAKPVTLTAIVDMNGTSDYIEMYAYFNVITGSGSLIGNAYSNFSGFKIG